MGVPHKVRRTDSSISFSIHPRINPPKPFADTYRTARTCYRENTSGCSKSRTGRRTWFPVQTVLGSSMLHLSIAPFLFLSGRITLCTTSIPPATAPAIYLYRNKRTTAPSPPATSLINNACDVPPRYSWTRHLKPPRYNLCDSMAGPLKLGTTVDLKASDSSMTHPLRFWLTCRHWWGAPTSLHLLGLGRVGAPHQYPLESAASYLCHFMLTWIHSDDSS